MLDYEKMQGWEFDVLQIYNLSKYGPLFHWYQFVQKQLIHVQGDILEAGVWRGRSLLSTSLLLGKHAPDRKVFGYDTFGGFESEFDFRDEPSYFKNLLDRNEISFSHFEQVQRNLRYIECLRGEAPNSRNVSSSLDFSNTSLDLLKAKIKCLGLKNIELVPGPFATTMNIRAETKVKKLAAVLIDCDLYKSYLEVLEFVWPKLSVGGMIYLDEYFSLKFPGARVACQEFFGDKRVKFNCQMDRENEFERWWVIKL